MQSTAPKKYAAVMSCPDQESPQRSELELSIQNISTVCEAIINDPHTHVGTVPLVIQALDAKDAEYRNIVMLSLVKVFKNIIPLYKIRLHSNKVRGSGECAQLQEFDKNLLHAYTGFVKRIMRCSEAISYRAACYLLESLDHFNLADRLISKMLRGTLERSCRNLCVEILGRKVRESTDMELVYSIISEMCSLKFHPPVLRILLEMNTFEDSADDSDMQDGSSEKTRKAMQRKIADGVTRIYISILRNQRRDFYEFVFCCLTKHKNLVRSDLLEGLGMLLNDTLSAGDIRTKLSCMQCILEIFGKQDYDFGVMVSTLFDIIDPGTYTKTGSDELVFLVRSLFVLRRQLPARARAFLQRLLQLCLIRHMPELREIIEEMKQSYSLDYRDAITVGSGIVWGIQMDLESIGSPASQRDCERLLLDINTLLSNTNKLKFPGYQPVSFMKCHIKNLMEEDYLVCEKSDGVRALLYICTVNQRSFGFFLDRKNTFYRLESTFPRIESTLFDGEVVVDSEGESKVRHFLICDAMLFGGRNITDLTHIERLSHALKFTRIYSAEGACGALKISVKEMQKAYGLHCVYMEQHKLKHGSDGLIFTPTSAPYRSGTAPKLLKWKPPHLNSVDFAIKRCNDCRWLYKLFCLGHTKEYVFFDYYFGTEDEDEGQVGVDTGKEKAVEHADIDGKLGEFRFDKEKWVHDLCDLSLVKGGWEFIKVRTDKDTPNAVSVVINVVNSIQEDVSIEMLNSYVPEIRSKWKLREAAQRR
ncbi:UNVERIFIED_CONTAM: hypothetical protein PYX00_011870 [Menopon gallinae]|uniref:mRNA guanylyltransferase n=1 Tax=Menopon gallinae TaxID=328185 RepID=A0AAW2H8K8_9NEOP